MARLIEPRLLKVSSPEKVAVRGVVLSSRRSTPVLLNTSSPRPNRLSPAAMNEPELFTTSSLSVRLMAPMMVLPVLLMVAAAPSTSMAKPPVELTDPAILSVVPRADPTLIPAVLPTTEPPAATVTFIVLPAALMPECSAEAVSPLTTRFTAPSSARTMMASLPVTLTEPACTTASPNE
ncbi:hypothetical protein D3C80_1251890 [compost metagenome]